MTTQLNVGFLKREKFKLSVEEDYMHIVGLIAEYNPFHKGHQYQLQKIRENFPESSLVVVMSGNVVQRGEFAILNKWQRAQLAMEHGVDLVVELPLWASLQSADYFAYWAVDLLARMQVDHLVFGSYDTSTQQFNRALKWMSQNEQDLDINMKGFLQRGYAYPAAMQAAIDALDPEHRHITFNMSEGNSLLGYHYLRVNQGLKDSMSYSVIKRSPNFLSGTQIRQAVRDQLLSTEMVPKASYRYLTGSVNVSWHNYFPFIQYKLLTMTPAELSKIQGMREGFENRLLKVINQVDTFDEFLSQLTSKRWAKSSVQRLLMMVLVNISQDDWQEAIERYQEKAYVRILACNDNGRDIISQTNQSHKQIYLFSNLTQDIYDHYQWIIQVDKIYQLGHKEIAEQNIGKFPIFCTKADNAF